MTYLAGFLPAGTPAPTRRAHTPEARAATRPAVFADGPALRGEHPLGGGERDRFERGGHRVVPPVQEPEQRTHRNDRRDLRIGEMRTTRRKIVVGRRVWMLTRMERELQRRPLGIVEMRTRLERPQLDQLLLSHPEECAACAAVCAWQYRHPDAALVTCPTSWTSSAWSSPLVKATRASPVNPSSRPGTRAMTKRELGTKPMNASTRANPSSYSVSASAGSVRCGSSRGSRSVGAVFADGPALRGEHPLGGGERDRFERGGHRVVPPVQEPEQRTHRNDRRDLRIGEMRTTRRKIVVGRRVRMLTRMDAAATPPARHRRNAHSSRTTTARPASPQPPRDVPRAPPCAPGSTGTPTPHSSREQRAGPARRR